MQQKFIDSRGLGLAALVLTLVLSNLQAEERSVRSTYGRAMTSTGECVHSVSGSENLCLRDEDGDGVDDNNDKCPGTPKGNKVDVYGCIAEVKIPDIFFDFNKAILKPGFEEALSGLIAEYRGQVLPDAIIITGHTDNVGSDQYNQKLSMRRAQAVKDYFVGMGIDGSIITTIGAGESAPIADNETEEGRSQNRRVLIQVKRASDMIRQ
ncbi:MAG: OmpA family protein [Gammaproteobacteria bacterium]|nr:OmpA family protein [Gammaproteobacteria bacterium]